MVTSLQFINSCLINVGETPANTVQSLNGMRGKDAANTALFEVCTLAAWPWVKDEVAADYWIDDVAYLPSNTHRILGVATGDRVAAPVSSQEIRQLGERWGYPYSSHMDRVRYYCVEGMDDSHPGVMVVPHPVDDYSKQYVKFRRTRIIHWPDTDAAEVPVPDVFIPLVKAKTQHNLAQTVGAEGNVIQAQAEEYERLAQRLRSTLSQHSPTGMNMYRRNRK
jgi:hypothetical protein